MALYAMASCALINALTVFADLQIAHHRCQFVLYPEDSHGLCLFQVSFSALFAISVNRRGWLRVPSALIDLAKFRASG